MSGESEGKPKTTFSRGLDWIKETSENIKTLLIALGALIAAGVPVYTFFAGDGPTPPPPAPCYKLKVTPHEDRVPISRVKSGDMRWFDLDFKNDCPHDLFVDVEFIPINGSIAISPPWPGYTIPAGDEITEKVPLSNLSLLNEEPQVIQIKVLIYRTGTRELLKQHTYPIAMVVG